MAINAWEVHPSRFAGNPVIPLVASTWYTSQVYDFCALINPSDRSQLLVYMTGMASPVATGLETIGLFTAPRSAPQTLSEYGQLLQPTGSGSDWDGGAIRLNDVLYVGSTYYLFYTGYPVAEGTPPGKIGVATASNPFGPFTRSASNPILTPTGQGRNDGDCVSQGTVLYESGTWTMIYSYRNGATVLPGFRSATSSDGLAWTKSGSGDVLTVAPLYGEFHHLRRYGVGVYVLSYEAGNNTTAFSIFNATASTVAGTYTNVSANPMLSGSGVPGTWDRYHVATPCPFMLDGVAYLYYQGAGTHDQPYGTNTWPGGLASYTMPITTFTFNNGSKQLHSGGSVHFTSDTIKARLVSSAVAPAIDDLTIAGYARIGTDQTLSGKTITNDTTLDRTVYAAANASFTSPGSGDEIGSVVVYKFVTDDSDSIPLFCLAVTPTPTDGTTVVANFAATGIGYTAQ